VSTPPGERLADWATGIGDLVEQGFSYLDLLTAVDRPDEGEIEVVAHLIRLDDGQATFVHTRLDRSAPRLASVTAFLPCAAWHEREIAEMFGVHLDGAADTARLLLSADDLPHPLRKDVYLDARIDRPWPGATPEAGGRARRGARAYGVPAPEKS